MVCLKFFSDKELARNPSLVSVMQNIDWFKYTTTPPLPATLLTPPSLPFPSFPSSRYIQSNIGFNEFLAKRSTELRLCGRAINSCLGWETFKKTSLLNASYNYIKVCIKISLLHTTELDSVGKKLSGSFLLISFFFPLGN